MKLSILIPIYNRDCRELARSLNNQADSLDDDIEIICVDDGSTEQLLTERNTEIGHLSHCRYIVRKQNVGRAAIRNYLVSEAQGEWLLFMDCDGRVIYMNFLRDYLAAAHDCDVVCGGVIHTKSFVNELNTLRYDYEHRSANRFTAEQRTANPQLPFRSFCFMIRRDAFERVRFDESFTDYGYEDVLFGQQLRQAGMSIRHIDNPLENTDIEANPVFIAKTEEALRTLYQHESLFADDVRLIRAVKKLESMKLLPLVKSLSGSFCPLLRRNLISRHPLTSLFDLYKLGYYVGLK